MLLKLLEVADQGIGVDEVNEPLVKKKHGRPLR